MSASEAAQTKPMTRFMGNRSRLSSLMETAGALPKVWLMTQSAL